MQTRALRWFEEGRVRVRCALLALMLVSAFAARESCAARLPRTTPAAVGMDAVSLQQIDEVVEQGIREKKMPGCVLLVARGGQVVLKKAYGHKQLEPTKVKMTTDTVFDLASVTKPVATATSVMMLVERGKLQLDEPVSKTIPEFGQNGKDKITIEHLLTHQGGLTPDNSLKDYRDGPEKAWHRIFALGTRAEPGSKFIYSDVGYMTLAEVVRHVTGKSIHEFTQENLFGPLGMRETGYLPAEPLRRRAATTERREGHWMRGEVHDPRAYLLGGIAGHAGLFSTADDLALYAQMMLNGGEFRGVRVLKADTVALMTKPRQVSSGWRGLGWDIRTGYSSNRGKLASLRAFGHGGFTGTAVWIDPGSDLFVIFLSNRVHPDGKGNVNPLIGRIVDMVVSSIEKRADDSAIEPAASNPEESNKNPQAKKDSTSKSVLTGIDVLERDGFKQLEGRRVGLITNHTGLNREGVSTVQLLREAPGVHLVAIFSPEHGIAGSLDTSQIADHRDNESGLMVYSLYGRSRKPTAESLRGVDTLVFDIQDIGARFYTYISTMGEAMRAASERKVQFVVLDRPNPIGGHLVAGPMLDEGRESFVGFHPLPVRHGMTTGELARMFNTELDLGLDLKVVHVEGWRRRDMYDATGLMWVNPSPNMRSLTEALLYPGVGLLETTNLSVGRGTGTPFEVIGAPWIDARRLAAELNASPLQGVRFVPIEFTPESSTYHNERCQGVQIMIVDREAFQSVLTGLTIAYQLRKRYPSQWQAEKIDRLLANAQALDALLAGKAGAEIEALGGKPLEKFHKRRRQYLLYE